MTEKYFFHPIDSLERISADYFRDNFDSIHEKVVNENTGYVICQPGKGDLVYCPKDWVFFPLDDAFGCMINSAVRYSIGRHTYMPGVICDFVRRYIKILDLKTLTVLIRDIEKELDYDIDQENLWVALKYDLEAELKARKKGNAK